MPAHKKPAERRQRTTTADLAVAKGSIIAAPAGMTGWRPEIATAWSELWSSPVAAYFKPTDVPSLRRLFMLRSRLVEALELADADPVVRGSTGQPILSPWFAEVHRLEAEIERLEDRFGLTPQARLRLGIQIEEGLSLAARNRELMEAFRNGEG